MPLDAGAAAATASKMRNVEEPATAAAPSAAPLRTVRRVCAAGWVTGARSAPEVNGVRPAAEVQMPIRLPVDGQALLRVTADGGTGDRARGFALRTPGNTSLRVAGAYWYAKQ